MKIEILLATMLLAGCGSNTKPTEPLGPVGNAVNLPSSSSLCYDASHDFPLARWPLQDAAYSWNFNGVIVFTSVDATKKCTAHVIFQQSDLTDKHNLAQTEFYVDANTITVTLDPTVPDAARLSTVCHELGHALGLGHEPGVETCMDPYRNLPKPSDKDLDTVGNTQWNIGVASRAAIK